MGLTTKISTKGSCTHGPSLERGMQVMANKLALANTLALANKLAVANKRPTSWSCPRSGPGRLKVRQRSRQGDEPRLLKEKGRPCIQWESDIWKRKHENKNTMSSRESCKLFLIASGFSVDRRVVWQAAELVLQLPPLQAPPLQLLEGHRPLDRLFQRRGHPTKLVFSRSGGWTPDSISLPHCGTALDWL